MTRRQPSNLVPLAPLSQRATWAKKPTEFDDQPTMQCPRCGAEMPDFDGVGVLAHIGEGGCGYCRHPSRDLIDGAWVCGICGDRRIPARPRKAK